MQIDDTVLQVKRHFKKINSQNLAFMMKDYLEEFHPEDEMMLRNMIRIIKCSSNLLVYDNGAVRSYFCGHRMCLVCNSIKLSRFLNKYLSFIENMPYKYHMVLSIVNPDEFELKKSMDSMFKFFNQSSIKRNKEYNNLNKKIILIRSFETKLKNRTDGYNNHFHCLLGGENEIEVIRYGEILIEYWLKYFGRLADRGGQYIEPQKKGPMENFKYLFKVKDINKGLIPMVYNLLKATKGRNLFLAKNIKRSNIKKELDDHKINDIKDAKIIQRFNYHSKAKNWIDIKTGEVFITDEKIKKFPEEIHLTKNYREVQRFFRDNSIKIPQKFPIKFDEQLPIF